MQKHKLNVVAEPISRKLRGRKAAPPPAIVTVDDCLYHLCKKHPFLPLYEFTQEDFWQYDLVNIHRLPSGGLRSDNREFIMLLNARVTVGFESSEPFLYCYKANSIRDIWRVAAIDFLFCGWAIYRRLM